MFKPILLSCAALLVAGTQHSTDYSPDKGFKVEVLTELSMKTTSSSFERDGEPVEGRGGGSGDMASSMKHQAVIVDTIVAVKEGKPSKLTRSFESLSGASTMSFGGEETTRDAEPQLDGVTLTLARAENGEIEAKVTEGTSPSSSDCLEGHRLELALDALLPEGEVADGASWELDKDAVRRALGLDMEKAYFPRAAPTEGDSPRGGFQVADFTDKNRIGVLSKDGPQTARKRHADIRIDGDLDDAVDVILDRILGGDQFVLDVIQFGQ
jgi:hypothetical protein